MTLEQNIKATEELGFFKDSIKENPSYKKVIFVNKNGDVMFEIIYTGYLNTFITKDPRGISFVEISELNKIWGRK